MNFVFKLKYALVFLIAALAGCAGDLAVPNKPPANPALLDDYYDTFQCFRLIREIDTLIASYKEMQVGPEVAKNSSKMDITKTQIISVNKAIQVKGCNYNPLIGYTITRPY